MSKVEDRLLDNKKYASLEDPLSRFLWLYLEKSSSFSSCKYYFAISSVPCTPILKLDEWHKELQVSNIRESPISYFISFPM